MDGSFKTCTVYFFFFFSINELMFQNLIEVFALCL